jgi:hypothetical protein
MQCSTVALPSERTHTEGDPDAAGSAEQDRRGTCDAWAPSRSAYLNKEGSEPFLLATESAIAINAKKRCAGFGLVLLVRSNKGSHLAVATTFSSVRCQRFGTGRNPFILRSQNRSIERKRRFLQEMPCSSRVQRTQCPAQARLKARDGRHEILSKLVGETLDAGDDN